MSALPPYPLSRKLSDIALAYGAGLLQSRLLLVGWLVLLTLLTLLARRGLLRRPLATGLAGLGLAAALAWAWHLRSLFDDAYISLRYAANLAHGNGLVFNIGERVEGFTNLLWTVCLAAAIRLGLDGPHVAVIGCLVAFMTELLVVARLSRLLGGEQDRPLIPYSAVVLGASYTFASYGTSGMETMASALLMTVAFERALNSRSLAAGFCAGLSIANHPDGVLLAGALGAALLLSDRDQLATRVRSAATYGVAVAAVYLPVLLWRWHYYGDLVPNTYYAKSADQAYFGQGAVYLTASAFSTGLAVLAPLAAVAAVRRPRALLTIYTLLALPLLFLYVARIGGDFMLGRLLVPLLPPMVLLAEAGCREVLAARTLRWQSIGALLLLAAAATPARLLRPREERWNLADERTWYTIVPFWPHVAIDSEPADRSAILQRLTGRGLHPLVAEMNVGQESYETDLPMIDLFGLTDRAIAHQPLERRGRPGHEKVASVDYLRSRGVQLSAMPMYSTQYAGKTRIRVHDRQFFLARYDPALVQAFKAMPDALVPNLPAMIDDYVLKAGTRPPETLREDAAFFDAFYFSCNEDAPRKVALAALSAAR
jgi:arabinofuranosyltransferase